MYHCSSLDGSCGEALVREGGSGGEGGREWRRGRGGKVGWRVGGRVRVLNRGKGSNMNHESQTPDCTQLVGRGGVRRGWQDSHQPLGEFWV